MLPEHLLLTLKFIPNSQIILLCFASYGMTVFFAEDKTKRLPVVLSFCSIDTPVKLGVSLRRVKPMSIDQELLSLSKDINT